MIVKQNSIQKSFPTLYKLLEGTIFEDDAIAFEEFAQSEPELREAIKSRVFSLNALIEHLLEGQTSEDPKSNAVQIERDLARIVNSVGLDATKKAFREKFLFENKRRNSNEKESYQNAQEKLLNDLYELNVAARMCDFLDPGSVELEKRISDSKKSKKEQKNSDIYGTFNGQRMRVEVTVFHGKLPPSVSLEDMDYVENAKIDSCFSLTLRYPLGDQYSAKDVRAFVELLYEEHVKLGVEDVTINDFLFEWNKGSYLCKQSNSPFIRVRFDESLKKSEIINPCSTQRITPNHVLEDNPNPSVVATSAALRHAPRGVPVSTEVRQKLREKLVQCEEGVINVVAIGIPLMHLDSDVESALLGAPFVSFGSEIYDQGTRLRQHRDVKSPFVPESRLTPDDQREFTQPFKKMSAVWLIRLGHRPVNKIICNPNAILPVPHDFLNEFTDSSMCSIEDMGYQKVQRLKHQDVSDFICLVETPANARLALVTLKLKEIPYEEQIKIVNNLFEPSIEKKNTKFLSLTDEQAAMIFVVDCGGMDRALECLDNYLSR